MAEHLKILDEALVFLSKRKINRLLVSMPPRHGKSELISKYFPAWYLLKNPSHKVILASYEYDFARTWGKKARDIFRRQAPFLGLQLKHRVQKSNHWVIFEHEGEMSTSGVGGPITGKGADILIIDDPVKNAEQALSPTYREKTWDWFRSTAYTRLEPDGCVIIIQTRWHEDDLTGRILKEEGQKWIYLNLPALAQKNDPIERQPGEALWPEKFPREKLLEIKRTIGSYWFEAMYQGNPVPEEGGIIKKHWIKFYKAHELPKNGLVIQSWDMSFKNTSDGSFIVGQIWGKNGSSFYLIDQVRFRGDFMDTLHKLKMLYEKYPQTKSILIEEKANGAAIISTLKRDIPGIVPINPKESKEARLHSISPIFEAGNVYLPKEEPWIEDYIDEITTFPASPYSDQVDATSQALLYLQEKTREFKIPNLTGNIRTGRRFKGIDIR